MCLKCVRQHCIHTVEMMRARRVFEKSRVPGGYALENMYNFIGFKLKQHAVRAIKRLDPMLYSVDTSNASHKYTLTESAVFQLLAKSRGPAADQFRSYLLEARDAFERNKENCHKDDVKRVDDQFQSFFDTTMSSTQTLPERKVQNKLYDEFKANGVGVHREVKLGALGVVDLVTDTELIEIKKVTRWKAALGQVLVYSTHASMQSKQRVVHLFGSCRRTQKRIIRCACLELGVLVRFEDEN